MKQLKLLLFTSIFLFAACTGNESTTDTTDDTIDEQPLENESTAVFDETIDGIRLIEITGSPEFPDAAINLVLPNRNQTVAAGNLQFEFGVYNYELGSQSPDADSRLCANSKEGQHIHLIVNNNPYTAHYDRIFMREIPSGSNVVLAFLSRSYHESIKNEKAYVLFPVNVGQEDTSSSFDFDAPHMFYSRPKGNYMGKDTERVLLDFYLVNTNLSETGNRVRATINGTEFLLTKWAPYGMEGLPMGTNTIRLELIDADGNLIESPYNSVEREFTLAQDEPLPN